MEKVVAISLRHTIVLEDASLELVPEELVRDPSCKTVQRLFGIAPSKQILDDNYHGSASKNLRDREKKGRPDVVHLALLEIVSSPIYSLQRASVAVHTITGASISFGNSVRLPRTLHRFNGVMSKILSGEITQREKKLFRFTKNQSFESLISELKPKMIVGFSSIGPRATLESIVASSLAEIEEKGETDSPSGILWVVGGFPFGHFKPEVAARFDHICSISQFSLPAHVVTARLCYELERELNIT